MQVRRFSVVPVILILSALVFHRCDTVDSPYDVPPVLEASSSEIAGTVGLPIDTFAVNVKNNVETESFRVLPNLPSGLDFESENGTIHGIPLESGVGEYSISAKNEHGNSDPLMISIRIVPASPTEPKIMNYGTGVLVTWPSAAGAETYRLFRSDRSTDTAAMSAETEDTFYVDTPLVSNHTYTYHVRAVGKSGTLSEPGPPLAIVVGGSGVEDTKPVFDSVENATAKPSTERIRLRWRLRCSM